MKDNEGGIELLHDPVARQLLGSRQPAHLGYVWSDGTPRVVPIWFTWTGAELVFGTPPKAPKLKVLQERPEVSVSIDDASAWPYRALLVRGTVSVEMQGDVVREYAQAAERYLGPEQGAAWVSGLAGQPMARIAVTPTWVSVLDFETRFPSALSS